MIYLFSSWVRGGLDRENRQIYVYVVRYIWENRDRGEENRGIWGEK